MTLNSLINPEGGMSVPNSMANHPTVFETFHTDLQKDKKNQNKRLDQNLVYGSTAFR